MKCDTKSSMMLPRQSTRLYCLRKVVSANDQAIPHIPFCFCLRPFFQTKVYSTANYHLCAIFSLFLPVSISFPEFICKAQAMVIWTKLNCMVETQPHVSDKTTKVQTCAIVIGLSLVRPPGAHWSLTVSIVGDLFKPLLLTTNLTLETLGDISTEIPEISLWIEGGPSEKRPNVPRARSLKRQLQHC